MIFSASLATVALFTSHWFDATVLTKTGGVASGAHVSAGLFWGERVIEYGHGARKHDFSGDERLGSILNSKFSSKRSP